MADARGFARRAGWNYLATFVSLFSSLVVTSIAFRFLSTTSVGVYVVVQSTVALLVTLDPAIAFSVTRDVSRLRTAEDAAKVSLLWSLAATRRLLRRISALAMLLGAAATVICITVGDQGMSTAVMEITIGISAIYQLRTAWLPAALIGQENFSAVSKATVTLNIVVVAVVTGLVQSTGIAALGAAQLAGILSSRLLLARSVRGTGLVQLLDTVDLNHVNTTRVRQSLRFSGSAALLTLSAQVINWSDVVLISAFGSTSGAAIYRVSSMLPALSASLLYRAYDVVYPMLSRRSATQQVRASLILLRVTSAAAGGGFATLIAMSKPVLGLLTGHESDTGSWVLALTCIAWAANIPAHALALMALARDSHAALVPVVLAEAAANIALTAIFVPLWGVVGAALGTAATMAIANLWAQPHVLRASIPESHKLSRVSTLTVLASATAVGLMLIAVIAMPLSEGAQTWGVATMGAVGTGAVVVLAAGRAGRELMRESFRKA